MKRSLLILAALTCACSWAGVASARLGALGRNDTVVTNVGEIARAESYGTLTRWTDATGCVWEASDIMGPWSVTAEPETEGLEISNIRWGQTADTHVWGWMFDALTPGGHGGDDFFAGGSEESTNLVYVGNLGDPDVGIGWALYFSRHIVPNGATNIVGRVALTNDIPRTPGAVGAYPAASGSALESGKQDRLPYPTNAIPFSAIDGAPSGGQEWRVVNYDVEVDAISFVTNGIAILTFINAGYAYGINVSTSGWPEGASMFVRGSFHAGATYTIPNDLRLISYGTWPTNNFQSVWWRSGTNIYVNVILEE